MVLRRRLTHNIGSLRIRTFKDGSSNLSLVISGKVLTSSETGFGQGVWSIEAGHSSIDHDERGERIDVAN